MPGPRPFLRRLGVTIWGTTTCSQCGTTYTGAQTQHCVGCHATFTSTWAGDKHRVGDHGITDPDNPNRRRCLTPDEMLAKGMTRNELGRWTAGGSYPAQLRGRR